ncbi:MAG: alpha/beta fold hydrolase [Solirubrobacterales bacterium]
MDETPLDAHAVSEVLAPEGDQATSEGAARIAVPWGDYVDTNWDKFDFTPYEQFIEIDGAKLNYIELGDASKPTLLYVHGLMGTWRNWILNLLPFADRYHVIAVDLPGFGLSEMPVGEFSIEHYADVIKEFSGKLGLGKITLIGNSMGGQIATIVAKKFPELLEKLVLVDAAGFSTSTPRLRKLSRYARYFQPLFKIGPKLRSFIASSRTLAGILTKIVLWRPRQVSSELILVLLAGTGKPGFVPAIHAITHTPVIEFPGEVTTETVIIWGRNDSLIPKKDAFRFAKMIPHAKLELMDDVGHIPMFETPERFNALIEQYAPAVVPVANAA